MADYKKYKITLFDIENEELKTVHTVAVDSSSAFEEAELEYPECDIVKIEEIK